MHAEILYSQHVCGSALGQALCPKREPGLLLALWHEEGDYSIHSLQRGLLILNKPDLVSSVPFYLSCTSEASFNLEKNFLHCSMTVHSCPLWHQHWYRGGIDPAFPVPQWDCKNSHIQQKISVLLKLLAGSGKIIFWTLYTFRKQHIFLRERSLYKFYYSYFKSKIRVYNKYPETVLSLCYEC